jgi:diguanylate cyclase
MVKLPEEPGQPFVSEAPSAPVTRPLMVREQEMLAREEAVARRERAAELRERIASERELAALFAAKSQVGSESDLRQANEQLVIAAVDALKSTELAELVATEMTDRAGRDVLTGLPNRALLADRLAHSIEFAQRHGRKVALLYLDLDNFKEVNDTLGHAVGDALLQSTARRLQACVRASDSVSRHGGDEFVVLLAEIIMAHDAVVVAEKLIKAMEQPHLIGVHEILTTVSIGFSLYPDDSESLEAFLTHADSAMYAAKKAGRNTYRRFTRETPSLL